MHYNIRDIGGRTLTQQGDARRQNPRRGAAPAGMAMLLAALAAQGDSEIHNIGQIERGYERIDERLRALGAQIERVDGKTEGRKAGA